ncbi:MAG: PEP-CTERM sorting domain-containing protein [Phycisphaerales bacterium]|nr:PEP-CTERM sorting domain-containing protein [Phycisphaerales bacterium]
MLRSILTISLGGVLLSGVIVPQVDAATTILQVDFRSSVSTGNYFPTDPLNADNDPGDPAYVGTNAPAQLVDLASMAGGSDNWVKVNVGKDGSSLGNSNFTYTPPVFADGTAADVKLRVGRNEASTSDTMTWYIDPNDNPIQANNIRSSAYNPTGGLASVLTAGGVGGSGSGTIGYFSFGFGVKGLEAGEWDVYLLVNARIDGTTHRSKNEVGLNLASRNLPDTTSKELNIFNASVDDWIEDNNYVKLRISVESTDQWVDFIHTKLTALGATQRSVVYGAQFVQVVPEPASLAMLAMGGLMLFARRRSH